MSMYDARRAADSLDDDLQHPGPAPMPNRADYDPPDRRRLVPVGLGRFLAMDFPPREMVLGPWLPAGGLAMIHAPDGFVVNSFAPKDEGDFAKLRDYVNERLGRPKWTPNKGETAEDIINRMSEAFRANPLNFNNGPKQKRKESKPKPRIVAIYVYKDAKGEPYLRVRRTSDKQYWQSHWTSTGWATGKPQGPKIPYRLPEMLAAVHDTV